MSHETVPSASDRTNTHAFPLINSRGAEAVKKWLRVFAIAKTQEKSEWFWLARLGFEAYNANKRGVRKLIAPKGQFFHSFAAIPGFGYRSIFPIDIVRLVDAGIPQIDAP